MALNMRTSQAGLDVIKAFEGFRARSEALPNGRWIIGYGHMRRARQGIRVSEIEAEAILREYDLPPVERYVMRCVLAPMSQNEFDALVSLAFNIGPKAFASSDVVAGINGGNRLEAAQSFDHWRRAKIGGRVQIVDALVRRRAAEKALFLNAPGRMPVASSRLYRAMHDSDAVTYSSEPREILVEHRPETTQRLTQLDEKPETTQLTATEEAAESVRQQMVRILGETESGLEKDVFTDGASPEEITAAISELAGDDHAGRVQKSVWPQREDLPPPPFSDEIGGAAETSTQLETPALTPEIIDDLEEVQVSQDSIDRAIEVNKAIETEDRAGSFLTALPFGVLALIGAVLGSYGTAKLMGLVGASERPMTGLDSFLPIFLILIGVILLGVMGYYFVRTLASDDQ